MKKKRINASLIIGIVIIGLLILIMIVSFFYTPYDANKMDINARFERPDVVHWLGTDNFGRDILSRIMKGTQTIFLVGLTAVSTGLFFGILIGACAGYFGAWIDEIIMRFIDAMMAFPGILLALMIITVSGTGTKNTMLAIGIMSVPGFARIARSGFIQCREYEFVKAAKARGAGHLRIMFVHILPNVLSPLIVAASIGFGGAVLTETGLSYLGLGIKPPDPSWGRMLSESQGYLIKAPWYTLSPGIMITLSVLGFNLLGDGMRELNNQQ